MNRNVTNRYGGNQVELDSALNQSREPMVQYVLNMMGATEYKAFKVFADQGFTTGSGASGSLEGIHGNYHGLIGGTGHMGAVAVAAFDPVFWIHHCQIDRWFAIWQAIHPDSWYSSSQKDYQNADLLPFRSSKVGGEKFWKPDQTRDWKTFGYTYADVEFGSPKEVLQAFKDKYGWSCRKHESDDSFGKCPDNMKPLPVLENAQVFKYSSNDLADAIIGPVLAQTAEMSLLAADSSIVAQEVQADSIPSEATSHEQTADPSDRAFVNVPEEVVNDPGSSTVEESKADRQWFVDVLVERYVPVSPATQMLGLSNTPTVLR
jgi:tyrosinase